MLSSASIKAAEELANSVTHSGIELVTKASSPLDVIIQTMEPIIETEGEAGAVVAKAARPISSNFDAHTAEIMRVADITSQQLMGNIKFVRGVINPLCREILIACNTAKVNVEAESPLNVNIINVSPLPLFNSTRLEDLLSRYSNVPLSRPSGMQKVTSLLRNGVTSETLIGAMKNTNDQWNGEITKLVEIMGLQDQHLTEGFLCEANVSKVTSKDLLTCPFNLINFLVITGTLAGKLENFNANDISLVNRAELSSLQAYYGSALKRQIDTIRTMVTRKSFLLVEDSNKDTVYVYERMYRAWLKDGGSSEALIAAVASGRPISSFARELTKTPEVFASTFDSLEKRYKGRARQISLDSYRRVIEAEIISYIKEEIDVEERVAHLDSLRTFMKSFRLEATDDLSGYTKRIVCHVFGKDSHAYLLQSEMDAYLADNEDATIKSASVHACVKLLAKWAYAQMNVNKVNITPSTIL